MGYDFKTRMAPIKTKASETATALEQLKTSDADRLEKIHAARSLLRELFKTVEMSDIGQCGARDQVVNPVHWAIIGYLKELGAEDVD